MARPLRIAVLVAVALVALAGAVAHAGELLGTPQGDTLVGTAADDSLYGGAGADVLRGLGGNDDLDGGAGADAFDGGPGDDAVSYADARTGVDVTLDGRASGAPGEGDTLKSVEDVYGGPGDDVLKGNGAANTLDGGDGNDTLTGGKGTDGLYGGDGNDVLDSRDGTIDTVDCGAGDDIVNADAGDVTTGCERRGKGVALPSARTTAVVNYDSATSKGRTTITSLVIVDGSPPTAAVRVLCRGGGCPFRAKSFALSGGTLDLTSQFRRRKLRPGALVRVLVAAPDTVGKFVGLTIRSKQAPKARYACIRPEGTTAITCPKGA